MLLGEFFHSVDAKGRVTLPSRWREELKEIVVLTKSLDRCLSVMTSDEFEREAARLESLTFQKKVNRSYLRLWFSGSSEEQIDRQGRITIPSPLRAYAGLDKEVVLVGAGGRAEIWDANAWQKYHRRVQPEFEDLAERVVEGGRHDRT